MFTWFNTSDPTLISGGLTLAIALAALSVGRHRYGALSRRLVTSQAALQEARCAEQALAIAGEGMMVTDLDLRILRVNPAFSEITGYTPAEAIGQTPGLLKSSRTSSDLYNTMWAALDKEGHWTGEIWNRRASGERYPERLNIATVYDPDGLATHYVGVFSDISPEKRDESLIHHLATQDPLTGLINWEEFQRRVQQTLTRMPEGSQLALLLFDLDRFRSIKETLGDDVGNFVLQATAERLVSTAGENALVARHHGDEFGILLEFSGPVKATAMASQLLAAIMEPLHILGHEHVVTACAGISIAPCDGSDAPTLLRHLDLALYQAKREGRNLFRLYTEELSATAAEALALETSLREAITERRLTVHYQPLVNLATGLIIGVEALARWPHREMGMIPPSKFIPLAEESGLIIPLGNWVLREACQQLAAWRREGHTELRLSVNFSPLQFQEANWLDWVRQVLLASKLPPQALEIEITEGTLLRDPEQARLLLEKARSYGIQVAVDDFGTGYSSLSYLKTLPVDHLKIDQSFVRGCPDDASDVAIVEAVIGLASRLNQQVIAEGVETRAQLDFLLACGCHEGQGYLFSRPLPAENISALLAASRQPVLLELEQA